MFEQNLIAQYNNSLQEYKQAYINYLEDQEGANSETILQKNTILQGIVEKIKNKIKENKNEFNVLVEENLITDEEIRILTKILRTNEKLEPSEMAKIKDLVDNSYKGESLNKEVMLEMETKNEKLLTDLEEYSQKKKYTMTVLSIINGIFLIFIIIGLTMVTMNKKFKIPYYNS